MQLNQFAFRRDGLARLFCAYLDWPAPETRTVSGREPSASAGSCAGARAARRAVHQRVRGEAAVQRDDALDGGPLRL